MGAGKLWNAVGSRRRRAEAERFDRLRAALPAMHRWIDDLLAAHEPRSRPVSELGYAGLSACFPASLLDESRVVKTSVVPFPPVAALGLPELEAMAKGRLVGITYRSTYFVDPSLAREPVHFHELVHVIQWRAIGFDEFLAVYVASSLLHGYERNPLEATAYDLEAAFSRGARPSGLVELVTNEAVRARAAVDAALRARGIEIG